MNRHERGKGHEGAFSQEGGESTWPFFLKKGTGNLADGLPEDVWFMWMEAPATTRSGRPSEKRRAVWRTTRAIKDRLIRRGFLPERASVVTPICRFDTIQPAP